MLGTFEKARAVLDLYSTERPEWGVSEVARRLALSKSTAHVLLTSLAQMGLLHRTLAGRYRLGFGLLALSEVLLANTPWREVAREEMTRLAGAFGEPVHLAAFDGGQIVNVAGLEGRLAGGVAVPGVGAVLPAHASAGGKVLLAHRPREVVEAVTGASGLERLTDRTLGTPEALAEALERVRAQGYAWEVGERHPDVCAVAAPVRNHNGEVIAAVSLSVPAARFGPRAQPLTEALIHACAQISSRIGYQPGLVGEGPLMWMSVQGRDELRPAPRRARPVRPPPDPSDS